MLQTMLPPPVPTGMHAVITDERRSFLDPPRVYFDKIVQRRDSCDSGMSCPSRDSGVSRQSRSSVVSRQSSSSQIEVPLQVVSSSSPEVAPPAVVALDLIARARQDLTAPLPPQLDSQQSGHFSQHTLRQHAQQAQPGSLRCASQASLDACLAGAFSSSAASSCTAGSPSVEVSIVKLQREKQQLVEWGECLCKQVNDLQQEKFRGEQNAAANAAAASASRRQLEEENERLRQWGSKLERQANTSAAAGKENEDLRKQLAAYAVEVDALRDENEKSDQSRREAQKAVSRLTEEREELQRQIDCCKRKEEVENLKCKDKKDAMCQANIEQLNAEIAKEQDNSKVFASALKSWSDAYVELEGEFVAQTREFGKLVNDVKEQHRQAQEDLEAARREIEKKMELLERIQSELATTQQSNVENCRSWQERACHQACEVQMGAANAEERVTAEKSRTEERLMQLQQKLQHDFEQEKLEMEERLASESAIRRKLEEELRRLDQSQQDRNGKRQHRLNKDRGLVRLERALDRNIARDMFELHRGTMLDKVHARNCRREPRMVVVLADEMQMRWSKASPGVRSRSQSRLDLYEVIRIHYGSMSRACVLHTDIPPWLCFSLHTPRRSYDFCCPDEDTVQRFVLGLSRLCDWASGTIPTRSRFVASRGWCKLEDHCFHEQISLGRLLIDAIERIRDAPGKIEHPQGPPRPPV